MSLQDKILSTKLHIFGVLKVVETKFSKILAL